MSYKHLDGWGKRTGRTLCNQQLTEKNNYQVVGEDMHLSIYIPAGINVEQHKIHEFCPECLNIYYLTSRVK